MESIYVLKAKLGKISHVSIITLKIIIIYIHHSIKIEFNRRGRYKDYLIYLFHLKYNHSSGRVPLSSKSFFPL